MGGQLVEITGEAHRACLWGERGNNKTKEKDTITRAAAQRRANIGNYQSSFRWLNKYALSQCTHKTKKLFLPLRLLKKFYFIWHILPKAIGYYKIITDKMRWLIAEIRLPNVILLTCLI